MSNSIIKDRPAAGAQDFTDLPSTEDTVNLTEGAVADPTPVKAAAKSSEANVSDGVAAKYQNKTVEDLISMHAEAESAIGRQGQEIGHLRGLTDQLLELKRTDDLTKHGGAPADAEVTADDLLESPEAVIAKMIEQQLNPVKEALTQSAVQSREQAFSSRHPAYQSDMEDPKFQEFVRTSAYRQKLAQGAVNGDYDAAEDLWNAWSEAKPTVEAPAEETPELSAMTPEQQRAALKQAAMVTGGSTGDTSGKPVYSRQSLIRKRIEDPQGYYDSGFQAVIQRAYAEGRVR